MKDKIVKAALTAGAWAVGTVAISAMFATTFKLSIATIRFTWNTIDSITGKKK